MRKIVFRPGAEADLTAIALHIAEHSPSRAQEVIARLRKRTELLQLHALAGRPRDELGDGLRSLSERPYVVIYRLTADEVEIVAVLHGARDLPRALAARIEQES